MRLIALTNSFGDDDQSWGGGVVLLWMYVYPPFLTSLHFLFVLVAPPPENKETPWNLSQKNLYLSSFPPFR